MAGNVWVIIKFVGKYADQDSKLYVEQALQFIAEGLNDTNLALSQKNRWELIDLEDKLHKL